MTAKKTEKPEPKKAAPAFDEGARIDALEEKVAALQDVIASTFGVDVGPR